MQTHILIIGGGLSGLTATWQLRRAGIDALLIEARDRFGGRVLTVEKETGANCDLGPSWFWPGQPLTASLLNHFGIPSYQQHGKGTTLFQQPNGQVEPYMDGSPMSGSLRVEGGIQRLANAIANEIEPDHRRTQHAATGLQLDQKGITASIQSTSGPITIQAQHVGLAIPPRLAAQLVIQPELPNAVKDILASTSTWMAGHAKFFAVYDQPFWRDKGLCGSAISQQGPLTEIHDASPDAGKPGCLFGFSGLDAASRAELGPDAFSRAAIHQLTVLFGDEAANPIAMHFQDWSTEPFTASEADRQPQTRHPQYGLDLDSGSEWGDRVDFISSESSFESGGLIEGAIESGLRFSRRFTDVVLPGEENEASPHKASMGWDWL